MSFSNIHTNYFSEKYQHYNDPRADIPDGAFIIQEKLPVSLSSQDGQQDVQATQQGGQNEQQGRHNGTIILSGSDQSVTGWQVPTWDGSVSVVSVIDGARFKDGYVDGGGMVIAGTGGFAGNIVLNGGMLCINGGVGSGLSNNGGLLVVENGGNEHNGHYNGATIIVDGGTTWNDKGFGNGDVITVKNGGTINQMNEGNGGTVHVSSGGIINQMHVGNGGTIYVSSGGVSSDSTICDGHYVVSSSGYTVGDHIDGRGAGATILGGGSAMDIHVSAAEVRMSSGAWASTDDLHGSLPDLMGTMYVGEGAVLNLGAQAGGEVQLDNGKGMFGNDGVVLDGLENVKDGNVVVYDTCISKFREPSDVSRDPHYDTTDGFWHGGDSDGLVLQGIAKGDVTGIYDNKYSNIRALPPELQKYFTGIDGNDYAAIHLKNGGWIIVHIDGIGGKHGGGVIGIDSKGDLVFELCYLEGTRILTPGGYRHIEDLRSGEPICVAEKDGSFRGRIQKIRWIGRKMTDVRSNIECSPDGAGYAVCIRAGAFFENVPQKDLWVTAEHCFFFDGKFVPIRMLVNGRTIDYDYDRCTYIYYHLETSPHSILFAEGALSESYLDTDNRRHFIPVLEKFPSENKASIFRLPSRKMLPYANYSWNDAAVPLDVRRDFVEPLWWRLAARAGLDKVEHGSACNALGEKLSFDGQIALLYETELGEICRLFPETEFLNAAKIFCYRFILPKKIGFHVYLSSRVCRPCDAYGPYLDDRRELGCLVKDIYFITEKEKRRLTEWQTDDRLSGWANVEPVPMRWTTGKAEIRLPTPATAKGEIILEIEIVAQGPYVIDGRKKIFSHVSRLKTG